MKTALTIMALLSIASATTLKSHIQSRCETPLDAKILAETKVPTPPAAWYNKLSATEVHDMDEL